MNVFILQMADSWIMDRLTDRQQNHQSMYKQYIKCIKYSKHMSNSCYYKKMKKVFLRILLQYNKYTIPMEIWKRSSFVQSLSSWTHSYQDITHHIVVHIQIDCRYYYNTLVCRYDTQLSNWYCKLHTIKNNFTTKHQSIR